MRTTRDTLQRMYAEGKKIAVLTCYDATFAHLLENVGIDILLVGDSLGSVLQGHDHTLSVTLDDMIYHTQCVVRGSNKAFIMVDMPFGSSQVSPEETFVNAARLVSVGAQMVKIEGGQIMAETVDFLTRRGIPVCGHIGLMPQSVHQLGGYKVQGRTTNEAEQLFNDAMVLQEAGAAMVVLETIPASLASKITRELSIPTIGIGAGIDCSAQVLVLHDMLGIYPGNKPRFVKNFMSEASSIQAAIERYVEEVKTGQYPGAEHSF